jgi:hypothetical protein
VTTRAGNRSDPRDVRPTARRRGTSTAIALLLAAALIAPATANAALSRNVKVLATGLDNPRGLAFGPGGNLYVAEGGLGGTRMTTASQCQQVLPPVGPYLGGFTARISKINRHGVRTTVVGGLPSSVTDRAIGSDVSGVADVAFIGHQLYALEAGAGCSHGLLGTDNTVLRVNRNGKTKRVADLSRFLKAHPVKHPDVGDFEPDGTWYSMIAVRGNLYAVEPNHEEIDRISPKTGKIKRLVDLSQVPWWGPTSIAYNGNFLVGNLGEFPIVPGSEQIRRVNSRGKVKTVVRGLTTVLGLAVGSHGRLYALESMTAAGLPAPSEAGTGKVVQINASGKKKVIASGLSFPTGMTLGPDGALYVSNLGFGGPTPGVGQILRIKVPR